MNRIFRHPKADLDRLVGNPKRWPVDLMILQLGAAVGPQVAGQSQKVAVAQLGKAGQVKVGSNVYFAGMFFSPLPLRAHLWGGEGVHLRGEYAGPVLPPYAQSRSTSRI